MPTQGLQCVRHLVLKEYRLWYTKYEMLNLKLNSKSGIGKLVRKLTLPFFVLYFFSVSPHPSRAEMTTDVRLARLAQVFNNHQIPTTTMETIVLEKISPIRTSIFECD